jgi:GrpB-like predicted nucleotidyltransferase (UPF0157 family)
VDEERLRAVTIGELRPLDGPIRLVEYDPAWPQRFAHEAQRIRAALGARALAVEHCGSTAVPGLAAKPLVDVVLAVADAGDEAAYLPDLSAAGYVLRIREPDWLQHRLLVTPASDVNLHVFSAGCPEIARMLRFRDWLRGNADDRRRYEDVKQRLAAQDWRYVQEYADAKSRVVTEILDRADAAARR